MQFFLRPDLMASRSSSIATSAPRSGAGSSGIDAAVAASSVRPSQAASQRPASGTWLQALSAVRPPTQAQSGAQPLSAGSGLAGPGSGGALSLQPSQGTAALGGGWAATLRAGRGGASMGTALDEAPSWRPSQGRAASAGTWAASLGGGSGGASPSAASSSKGSASAGGSYDAVESRQWDSARYEAALDAANKVNKFKSSREGTPYVNYVFAELAVVEFPDTPLDVLVEDWNENGKW